MATRGKKRKSKKPPAKSRKVKRAAKKPASVKRLRIPRGYPGAGRFVSRELLEAIRFEIRQEKARQKALRIHFEPPEDFHEELIQDVVRKTAEYGYEPVRWKSETVFLSKPPKKKRKRKKGDRSPRPWTSYQIMFSHSLSDNDVLIISDAYREVLTEWWPADSKFMFEILIGEYVGDEIEHIGWRSMVSARRDSSFEQLPEGLREWSIKGTYKSVIGSEEFAIGVGLLARNSYKEDF